MERIETLRMEGVTRQYGSATALIDFTLDIQGGTFTTLLGFVMVLAPTAWITLRAARRSERNRPSHDVGLRERSLAS